MGSLSLEHWLIVLVVLLLVFGAGRVSEIGKGLGQSIKEFKKGIRDEEPDASKATIVDAEANLPKQLPATSATKKIITLEVDDDEDPEELAKKIVAAKKKAAASTRDG